MFMLADGSVLTELLGAVDNIYDRIATCTGSAAIWTTIYVFVAIRL